VYHAVDATIGPTHGLRQALGVLDQGRTADICRAAAGSSRRASHEAPASYRDGPGRHFVSTAAATTSLLEAAEMLCALAARRQAEVELEALHRATGIGVPPAILQPESDAVVRLEPHRMGPHPADTEEVAFVAAAAQAVELSALVLANCSHEGAARDEARETLADAIYELLFAS
jgi:alpha-beta hydrolase superfamily lysophospholipase